MLAFLLMYTTRKLAQFFIRKTLDASVAPNGYKNHKLDSGDFVDALYFG